MAKLKLSILDQSPISAGGDRAQGIAQAIIETVALARHCDRLGYHRYWLAEHHGTLALAGNSPEILIARIASVTEHMRIGAGGILLNLYPPSKVAENFQTLEALFPGRIDLGLGRVAGTGPGGDQTLDIKAFPRQVRELLVILDQHKAPGPEVWVLGSSPRSAINAAELGLPYSYGHFINQTDGVEAMCAYRQSFHLSKFLAGPKGSLAAFVICAETQEEADILALSREGYMVSQRTGIPGPIPAPETVRDANFTTPQRQMMAHIRSQSIIGPPGKVHDQLIALADAHGIDEIVVVTITHAYEARRRSYELLAGAF